MVVSVLCTRKKKALPTPVLVYDLLMWRETPEVSDGELSQSSAIHCQQTCKEFLFILSNAAQLQARSFKLCLVTRDRIEHGTAIPASVTLIHFQDYDSLMVKEKKKGSLHADQVSTCSVSCFKLWCSSVFCLLQASRLWMWTMSKCENKGLVDVQ